MGDFVCRGSGDVKIKFRNSNSAIAGITLLLTRCFLLLEKIVVSIT